MKPRGCKHQIPDADLIEKISRKEEFDALGELDGCDEVCIDGAILGKLVGSDFGNNNHL